MSPSHSLPLLSPPADAAPPIAPFPFHLMAKPIGPICNLDCKYCFYLEKEKLYPNQSNWRMNDALLESYIRQYIQSQPTSEISFTWQGGEPTLMGLDFFRRAVELQKQYAGGKTITNALQTNGTLLDDAWCEFFLDQQFLIGLSIDGPCELHDYYRVDKAGEPTFAAVMRGMDLLKQHRVDFNTLCVVNRQNQHHPLKVYEFLKGHGALHIQFIPLVERIGSGEHFASPPGTSSLSAAVTPFSVEPLAYGQFLSTVFDHWVRNDVGRVYVQIFDVMLGIWLGIGSPLCLFRETCGQAMALEHNGDLYSCDHFVYPQYKLGNISQTPLATLVASPQQLKFGQEKRDTLPAYCHNCDVRFACHGECPKHRFAITPDGEPGLNYLCPGYKHFLHHVDPYMRAMGDLIRDHQPPARIMQLLANERTTPAQQHRSMPSTAPSRNAPCPCGSGKKFKRCCGAD